MNDNLALESKAMAISSYEIPTEEERRALFRFLKQQSSLSTWERIKPYYTSFVNEFNRLLPIAFYKNSFKNEFEPALSDSEYRLIIVGYAAFCEAIERLKKGEKSVFKWKGYGTGAAYFCEAIRPIDAWQTQIFRRPEQEIPLAETPYWDNFERIFLRLTDALGNGGYALQERYTDVPAPIDDISDFRRDGKYKSEYRKLIAVFDKLLAQDLPPVPSPTPHILVKTGDTIPFYGIWEPVRVSYTPGFAGLFKKPIVPEDGELEIDGCMNYLHAFSPAPTIGFPDDNARGEGRPTVWRLLWQDDRYADGTIPEEEKEYFFYTEEPVIESEQNQRESASLDLIVRTSGQTANQSGIWAVKNDLQGRASFNVGDVLPQHDGRDVEWVWINL